MSSTTPIGTPASNGGGVQEISLYERWRKIQTLWVDGRFQRLRRITLGLLVGVYYAGPWLTWNGAPALWFDLPGRKFSILSLTFWPQDFILLSWLLIIAAFTLFVFTVIAGRLWCGYACPQTVWTLCYVWIEKWVEGDRTQRLKLERAAWNASKIRKKATKYGLWSLLALSISVTFVGYFVPIRELLPKIMSFDLLPWERFWLVFPAAASLLFSGVLREQVCLHMCPYARFQSVMFDRDTLIVSYDVERGEPRGSRARSAEPDALELGSCIDCRLCVHACPTGIDIRDGLQYECIGCAACIDACNGIMDRMGYAPDLIRYGSENQDEHTEQSRIRPRLLGYAAVLTAMVVAFGVTLTTRVPLELDIIRDRNRLYRELYDGTVENTYTLRILNMEQHDRAYRVLATGDVPLEYSGPSELLVPAGQQLSVPVSLIAHEDALAETNSDVQFSLETVGEPSFEVHETSRFLRPPSR